MGWTTVFIPHDPWAVQRFLFPMGYGLYINIHSPSPMGCTTVLIPHDPWIVQQYSFPMGHGLYNGTQPPWVMDCTTVPIPHGSWVVQWHSTPIGHGFFFFFFLSDLLCGGNTTYVAHYSVASCLWGRLGGCGGKYLIDALTKRVPSLGCSCLNPQHLPLS